MGAEGRGGNLIGIDGEEECGIEIVSETDSNKTNVDHPVLWWRDSDTFMNDATSGTDDRVLHINVKHIDANSKVERC